MSAPTIQQLVEAQGASQEALTLQATAQTRAQLLAFDGWYDDAAVAALGARIGGQVQSVQRAVAQVTDVFAARTMSQLKGSIVKPVGAVPVSGLRLKTTPALTYTRLGEAYRFAVSKGAAPEKALKLVTDRGQAMAATDTQLAQRAQWHRFMQGHRVDGYRRVIHPELSKGGTCGLCIAASDRIYHVDELLPIHTGCHCGVLPIINGVDVGHRLNQDDFKRLYAESGSTSADDLKRTQWVIHQHGELGPVLAHKGDDWRSPADVADAA